MIAELKPYAKYKESGLPWLGHVPAHWELRRTKTILREVDRRSTTGSERLLSLRMYAGLVDHHALGGKLIPPSALVGYKCVAPGEIVMNRMRAAAGLFAAATSDGLVSPDYATFRPACPMSVAYFVQLFRTPALTSVFRLESRGLGTGESGFLRLYSDRFGMLPVPFPVPAEQEAIVRFLDWTNERLEWAIRAKRKAIALLNEQRQAIIHRAVTCGLDPSVLLKPSGIPWLGDIPQHWNVRKLKYEMSFRGGGTPSKGNARYWNGTIPWVSPKDMKSEVIHDTEDHITERAVVESSTNLVPAGSLLMVVRSGILQRAIPVARCIREVALNQDMKALTSKGRLELDFFVLFIRGCEKRLLQVWTKQGATVESVEHQYLANTKVPIPPLPEQQHIVERLALETTPQTTVISRLEREIELLREYRTRLVADVVTGKLDVRGAAARLPCEAPLETVEDDTDLGDETEAADEKAAV